MRQVLAAFGIWLVTTILTVDFVYQAGVIEGQRIRSLDIKTIIAANKEALTEVCYAWWFKTQPKDKNLSGLRKSNARNSQKSGTMVASK